MNTLRAIGIIEGEEGSSEYLDAWQHLIDTGTAWTLQGWYGRAATELIRRGVCRPAPEDGRTT